MKSRVNILAIAYMVPEPDQASGDLRFFTILEMLAGFGKVSLVLRDIAEWRAKSTDYPRYQTLLAQAGVELLENGVHAALSAKQYDLVIFEFYHPAIEFGKLARHLQPRARIVVDSVDVHFNRLAAKAMLTGSADDLREAEATRVEELAAYRAADLVAVVSEEDSQLILANLPGLVITVLPNVHTIHERPGRISREFGRLVFVGSFRHSPNVDAMLYFVGEVMPLIRRRIQGVRLSIVGSHPTNEINALAGEDVEVLGYVPDTAPYLQSAYISIAPLRYGGGLKGKVGEAMSHGLPVVTTSYGAEGFGLTSGQDLLLADTSAEFADAIVSVLEDAQLHEALSKAGHHFIDEHYSPQAMRSRLVHFLDLVERTPPARLPLTTLLARKARVFYERHLGWRRGN